MAIYINSFSNQLCITLSYTKVSAKAMEFIKGKTNCSFNNCAYKQMLTPYLSVFEWT
jgi:hypothetical protein